MPRPWDSLPLLPGRKSPLQLLVIQATPFCNIDCSYCYLPTRNDRSKLPLETLRCIFENLKEAELLQEGFSLVWHAGEPLVLPVGYYRTATSIVREYESAECRVRQCFQTNGTLVTDEFVAFAVEASAKIGVSLDGPEHLHDDSRRTRSGRGTHREALRGFRLLQAAGVETSIIAVLTDRSLDFADEIFEFFAELSPQEVGFNIEEVEGSHESSSLQYQRAHERYAAFMERLYALSQANGWRPRIRELAQLRSAILFGEQTYSTLNTPLAILSVDVTGNISTFSPEMVGFREGSVRPFVFGNVLNNDLKSILQDERFVSVWSDIVAGVDACKATCDYFALCGGGAPSNKYFENGTFRSTETMSCKLTKKTLVDVVLNRLEAEVRDLRSTAVDE